MPVITANRAGGQNVCYFLDLIAFSEGADYDTIVSGVDGPETFTDFSDHPFADGRPAKLIRPGTPALFSTASGRYEILYRWWKGYKESLKLPDFSPLSQDVTAIQQIRERGALPMIADGNIHAAINACSGTWASFPGNIYGQPGGHSMAVLVDQYIKISQTAAVGEA